MTPEDFLAGLIADPDFLVQDVDLINRRGLVVKLDEMTYRKASFLDNRAFIKQTAGIWMPLERLIPQLEKTPPATSHAIFHVSHCGSTLISRLLAELPGCLPLREPLLLLALSMARRDLPLPQSRMDLASLDRLMNAALLHFSRSYRPAEHTVIKATSVCGNLLGPFLRRSLDSKALLLHTDLETWLTVMLRDEGVRHNGRFYAAAWLTDLLAIARDAHLLRLSALSDAEMFAVNWLTAMLHFEQARKDFGERTRLVNFEDFLIDPARQLTDLGGFLGLDTGRAAEIATGPLMSSYAKNPSKPFDRAARDQELKQTRTRSAAEISAGMKFAEKLCDEIEMLAPLGAYLTRSNTKKE